MIDAGHHSTKLVISSFAATAPIVSCRHNKCVSLASNDRPKAFLLFRPDCYVQLFLDRKLSGWCKCEAKSIL
jgi:hypothetical protein